tara:strand:+ start:480 stop:1127 length:648 start_codon:yes stop_codon:yes gene_type:complete
MIEDNWKPTQDDIDWTKEHYTRMQVGDTWGVADAVLRKDEENTLTILQASPASLLPLERIKKVCEEIDVELISDGAEMIHDAQAAAQQAAQEWTCPKSGVPIVNFDLDNPEWICIDEGEEAWRVLVKHESEEGEVNEVELSPMDYNLVAGDALFFSWKGMSVLERHEIIDLADNQTLQDSLIDGRVFIMPTQRDGIIIPPHLRGLIFRTDRDEEE